MGTHRLSAAQCSAVRPTASTNVRKLHLRQKHSVLCLQRQRCSVPLLRNALHRKKKMVVACNAWPGVTINRGHKISATSAQALINKSADVGKHALLYPQGRPRARPELTNNSYGQSWQKHRQGKSVFLACPLRASGSRFGQNMCMWALGCICMQGLGKGAVQCTVENK